MVNFPLRHRFGRGETCLNPVVDQQALRNIEHLSMALVA
jgi:hypothetical protein